MLCQICKKNPATIHIQEVVNGKKQTLHLCLTCAGKRSFDPAALEGMDLADLMNSLEKSISEMGLIPFQMQGVREEEEEKIPDLRCRECGWTLAQFRKTGHLGCPGCYTAFEEELIDKLLSLHRTAVHSGKLPEISAAAEQIDLGGVTGSAGRGSAGDRLEMLERDLRQSILREEYELAARIRDQIAAIRSGKDDA